jgi:nucleoside-diphosphate-sugar epimerase
VRNFVSIDDVSDLFGWMASIGYAHDHKKFNNQIFNFGNNHLNISKRELCQRIKKFVPDFCVLESEINKDPDQRNYIVSNQKITQALPSNAFNHDDLDEHIQKILNACPIIKHSRTQFTNL